MSSVNWNRGKEKGVLLGGRIGVQSVGSEGKRELARETISSGERSLDRIGVVCILSFSLFLINLYVLFHTLGDLSSF